MEPRLSMAKNVGGLWTMKTGTTFRRGELGVGSGENERFCFVPLFLLHTRTPRDTTPPPNPNMEVSTGDPGHFDPGDLVPVRVDQTDLAWSVAWFNVRQCQTTRSSWEKEQKILSPHFAFNKHVTSIHLSHIISCILATIRRKLKTWTLKLLMSAGTMLLEFLC